jgi:hypothetical protein
MYGQRHGCRVGAFCLDGDDGGPILKSAHPRVAKVDKLSLVDLGVAASRKQSNSLCVDRTLLFEEEMVAELFLRCDAAVR